MILPTIKVCDGDGDYRIINATDFDPDLHTEYGSANQSKPLSKPEVRAALEAAGVDIPKGATVAEMRAMLEAVADGND